MICLEYPEIKLAYDEELRHCGSCKRSWNERVCPCGAETIKPLCQVPKCKNNATVIFAYKSMRDLSCLLHIDKQYLEDIAKESFRRTNML